MSKSKAIFLIILAIILVGILGYFFTTKKSPEDIQIPNIPPSVQTIEPIPEEYVILKESRADQAIFVFTVPIKEEDIIGSNIRHCVINVSVAAESRGDDPQCKETTTANYFSLAYEKNTNTLTIFSTAPSQEWGINNGPFRIGCAACVSSIEFNGIHTVEGVLLPRKMIEVY